MTRLLIAGTGVAAALVAAVVGFATLTAGRRGWPRRGHLHVRSPWLSVVLPEGWTVEERPGTWSSASSSTRTADSGVDYFERLTPTGDHGSTCISPVSPSRPA